MSDDLNYPNNRYLEAKKNEAKQRIDNVFEEFKGILLDRTHPDNQTTTYEKNIVGTLNRLLSAADELDTVTPGEGIFGLIVLSLRSILRNKNENVKLEARVKSLEREVKKFKRQK